MQRRATCALFESRHHFNARMRVIEWELAPDEVVCWVSAPDWFAAGELAAVLSAGESARSARFRREDDRRTYTVCRGVLRHLLTRYGSRPRGAASRAGPA